MFLDLNCSLSLNPIPGFLADGLQGHKRLQSTADGSSGEGI